MSDQDIPNTDNRQIAVLAIAWEIVKASHIIHDLDYGDPRKVALTNAVIEVYQALWNEQSIDDK